MNYKGKWALVTGASAGIGEAFANAYAERGANIVLVARRKDRLESLGDRLADKYSVRTRAFAADLSRPGAPQDIARELDGAGIAPDMLVNNAGFGLPGGYVESEWARHRDFLELMVVSYAHLTRLFLPGMLARGYGRIILVSSLAGLTPGSAGHTLYGASKAFLVSFAQSLAAECARTGVNACAVCPGFTYSEFHDVNDTRALVSELPKYMFMDAKPVAEGAIAAVERGHVVYVPGLWNKYVAWIMKALPRSWAAAAVVKRSARFRRAK